MPFAYFLIILILIYFLFVCYVSWCAASSHKHLTAMDKVPVCVISCLTALEFKSKQGIDLKMSKGICSRKEIFLFSWWQNRVIEHHIIILRLNKIKCLMQLKPPGNGNWMHLRTWNINLCILHSQHRTRYSNSCIPMVVCPHWKGLSISVHDPVGESGPEIFAAI